MHLNLMANYSYDTNFVRYDFAVEHESKSYNWLFLPGGPGGDSRYLRSLVDILDLPGNVWLIDLPGNGDNIQRISPDYNYDSWFDILRLSITRFTNPILVGHSFGGMLPLLFPELERHLKGFVILNASPSLWHEEALLFAQKFQLPDLTKEMRAFVENPNNATFKDAIDACMPYYFPQKTLSIGRALLKDIPYQFLPAVWWQKKALEINYSAKWIPQSVPTLILGGTFDCITPFTLFEKDIRFHRPNIELVKISEGGHLPWIENPKSVRSAFDRFCLKL